jgi:hypothetical protein
VQSERDKRDPVKIELQKNAELEATKDALRSNLWEMPWSSGLLA